MSDARIAVVVGTRPEIIKLAPILRQLGDRAAFVHTGQHYDVPLSRIMLDQLGLVEPDLHLGIGGLSRGQQLGQATHALSDHLAQTDTAAVLVQGDTNTTLAAALAANACQLPLIHVEAGLRSFDRDMPEEHNRVLTDHLADLCCAPTQTNVTNLRFEGIPVGRIALTGNTVVDALLDLRPDRASASSLTRAHGVEPGRFVLATLHRPENVDASEPLAVVLRALADLALPVLLPLHPHTRARVRSFGLEALLDRLVVTDPLGYQEFLGLVSTSAFLVSDSGGIQEEASVLKVPVVVVRRSTERPEVLGTFARLTEPSRLRSVLDDLVDELPALRERLTDLPSPYGDGRSAARILEAMSDRLSLSRALRPTSSD